MVNILFIFYFIFNPFVKEYSNCQVTMLGSLLWLQYFFLKIFNSSKYIQEVKGILHLWKDECVFKMGHLCRRNVKFFLNLELSRLRKARKCIFGLCG